jgi:hypothetical protein
MNLYQPTISGSLTVSGSVEIIGPFTMSGGSITGTASFAQNSGLLSNLDSGSFVGTGSFNSMSSSVSTRVTNIEGNYATTGSNIFLGAQTVCANITSTGTIIAQTLNVQQVTSSIVYSSGSNVFGNLLTDVQQFTGSVRITGSGPHFIQSGCVGIGTTTPQRLLHIASNTENGIYLSCVASQLIIGNNNTLASKTCSTTIALAGLNSDYFPTSCAGDTIIATQAGNILFGTGMNAGVASGTERMRITNAGIASFTCQICSAGAVLTGDLTLSSGGDRIIGINDTAGNSFQIQAASNILYYSARTTGGSLVFRTNGTNDTKFSIASTGIACFACQVCIGGNLVVNGGNIDVNCDTTAATDARINFYTKNAVNGDRISIYGYNLAATTANCEITYVGLGYCCTNNQGYINFQTKSGGAWCNTLTIINGRVGIGTNSPGTYKLNVNGTGYFVGTGQNLVVDSSTGTSSSYINTLNAGGNLYHGIDSSTGGAFGVGAYAGVLWHSGNYPLVLATNNTQQLRINGNGSVVMNTGLSGPRFFSYCADMCNLNGLGLDMAGCSYEFGVFFAYGTSDNGRISFGSYQQTCYRSKMIILGNGNIGVPGNATAIYNASDCRLKNNVEPLNYGLAQVMCINPVKFNWKCEFLGDEYARNNFGFIAQQVQSVLPDLVEQFGGSEVILSDGTVIDTPLRINEKNLTAVLVKAIQEQQCIINELRCENYVFKTCLGIA